MEGLFEVEYKKLNSAQREAVDALEGPVMVVAGPGTGKTQVLALRIANILKNTDTPANGVLALTFTRSGVAAMRDRLSRYIGTESRNVNINTFHSFAISLVEKYYDVLGFDSTPKLIEDSEAVFLFDEILNSVDWQYLKTRSNTAQYFSDLRGLISLLKRERINPEEFESLVNVEIKAIENDEENISTRGESKGQLKAVAQNKINSFGRTLEAVKFYQIYESFKKDRNLMDYDDVLEYAVQVVLKSESARSDIKEEYLYVLIDEHQDSSYVQNNFIKAVWRGTESPNIFVVGDDRQLIYGFSGANIDYFEEFSHIFGRAKLITLVENYRSTKNILDLADNLLESKIAKGKLKSNSNFSNKINLNEYVYGRDEIIGTALDIKNQISSGESPEDIAILVPKNKNIREVAEVLSDFGISSSSEKNRSFFGLKETASIIRILNIILNPNDSIKLCESLLDRTSGVNTFTAHKFIKDYKKPDILTIDDMIKNAKGADLFNVETEISNWGKLLKKYVEEVSNESIPKIVSTVGNDILIDKSENHEELLRSVEVVRTFIHLANSYVDKNAKANLSGFVLYLERLEEYNTHLDLAEINLSKGVNVMTLHKSKGLEYKHVYIMHMNEETLMSTRKNAFTLPEKIKELTEKKDIETAKRELYVAITRAKEKCTISYATSALDGKNLNLAYIIEDLQKDHFVFTNAEDSQKSIIDNSLNNFAKRPNTTKEIDTLSQVKDFVKERFSETRISVSMLNNFFECSWKWYFRNFLKLPEVKSKSLALGSAVHAALEFILKEPKLPSESKIKSVIENELIKEAVTEEKEFKKLLSDGIDAVNNWVDLYYKDLAKNRFSERDISLKDPKFPSLTMFGKIDLTEVYPNGDVVVTDFKTGKTRTKNDIEKPAEESRMSDYMRQLAMYSYLIEGSDKTKKVTASRLLFLEADRKDKNALYVTNIGQEEIDLLLRDIKDYNDLLNSGDWVNRECHAKSYGREGNVCEYCQRANKIFENI